MKVYTHNTGALAMKQDYQDAAEKAGVVVLLFGESVPNGGIVLTDCRPKGFKGGRGPDDPAATAICRVDNGKLSIITRFEKFETALKRAFKIASV